MSREQQLIEQAGGEYLGVQDRLVWFNEPETHTTMTVSLRAIQGLADPEAVALVKILMEEKRQVFASTRQTSGVTMVDSRLEILDSRG